MDENTEAQEWYDQLDKEFEDKTIPEGKEPEVKDERHGLNNPRNEKEFDGRDRAST